MLKIWGRPNSINVQKVLWTADELELAYDHVPAGREHGKLDEAWFTASARPTCGSRPAPGNGWTGRPSRWSPP